MLVTRVALVALLAAFASACSDPSVGPPPPTPTATPLPSPHPGILRGNYLLRIQPAASCPNLMSVSFPVQADTDDTVRYPGIQGVDLLPIPQVELELLDGGATVQGGIGTDGGIDSAEGVVTSLELVCTGNVTIGSDGTGEVLEGTASGFVEFAQGRLGTCKSPVHTWSLRRR